MEEQRGISTGISSEPASNSGFLGEKRIGNGLEENDELGSERVKVGDLDSDSKTSNLQSDTNVGIAPDAEGLGRVVREKEVLVKDVKPPTVLETSKHLPKANSIATDDDRCVANTRKQALLKNHTVKDNGNSESRGGHANGVSKNSSLFKLRETSESVGSPSNEKVGPFQMGSAAGLLGESDSMRRWMEMKRNGFLSGPLGGVAAPSSAVSSTPVEVPAQKPLKNKRRGDSFKKRNEVTRREQQQVDRFSNITAPSGLLTEFNPGIIRHVRSKKQVLSIIEALIRNTYDDASLGGRHADLNVRESAKEDRVLAFKLPQQATSLTVEAATAASQWLEFLQKDLSGRLSAVRKSRNRVQSVLTNDLPLLVSSRESPSNQESTLQMTNTKTSGDASSDKTVTETHQIWWSAKFNKIYKDLCDEERDLERTLNQVKEMLSRCNEGLRQVYEYSRFSSQSSYSSFGKANSNLETSMAVQAAAASIFSTCSYLLSMMKPPPTS